MKFNFKKSLLLILVLAFFTFGLVGCAKKEMQGKIAENEENIQAVSGDVEELQAALTELEAQINAAKANLDQLGKDKAAASELKELQTTVANHKEAFDALKGAYEAAKEALEQADADAQAALEAAKEAYEAADEELAGDLADLKEAYEAAKAALEQADADAATARAALQEQLDALEEAAATKEALAALEEDMNEALDALEEAAATKEELAAKAQELEEAQAALAQRVAALEEAATKAAQDIADIKGDIADIKSRMAQLASQEALEQLQEQVEALPTFDDVEEAIAALAEAAEGALNQQVEALLGQLAETNETIAAMNYIDKGDYEAATALLAGDSEANTIELSEEEQADWDKIVEDVRAKVGELEVEESAFSFKNWQNIVDSVREDYYTATQYKLFKAYADSEKFFLGRDLTVADVEKRFSDLRDYICGLPTLEESLHMSLAEIEFIKDETITEGTKEHQQWEEASYLFYKLAELMEEEKYEIIDEEQFAEDSERFLALEAAYDNLVEAKAEFEALIEAIDGRTLTPNTHVAYLKVEDEEEDPVNESYVGDQEDLEDLNYKYFVRLFEHEHDEEEEEEPEYDELPWNEYPEGYGLKDLKFGKRTGQDVYDLVAARVAYIEALEAARDLFDEEVYGVLPEFDEEDEDFVFNGEKYNKILADFEKVQQWAEENGVDADNVAYIFEYVTDVAYEVAEEAKEYAEDLDAVYEELVVEAELAEKLLPLQEEDFYAEYPDKEELLGYRVLLNALYAGVEAVTEEYEYEEGVTQADYKAMLEKAGIDEEEYEAIERRYEELDNVAEAIQEQLDIILGYEKDENDKYIVTLSDYDKLFNPDLESGSVRATLDAIYDYADIARYVVPAEDEEEDLSHNRSMTKDVELAYNEIAQAYNEMAYELKVRVERIQQLLAETVENAPLLIFASALEARSQEIAKLIVDFEIKNQFIVLSLETAEEVNFHQLQYDINVVLTAIYNEATEAEEEYYAGKEVVEAVNALMVEGKWDIKLNDAKVVNDAYEVLYNWCMKHFDKGEGRIDAENEKYSEEIAAMMRYYINMVQQTVPGKYYNPATGESFPYDIREDETVYDYEEVDYEVNSNRYYFFTNGMAKAVLGAKAEYEAQLAEAEETWNAMKDEVAEYGEKETFTIHDYDKYEELKGKVEQYKEDFYDAYEAAETVKVLGEEETIAAFDAAYESFSDFYADALADAKDINDAIIALYGPAYKLTETNLDAVAEEAYLKLTLNVANIMAAIETFNDNYDPLDRCNVMFTGKTFVDFNEKNAYDTIYHLVRFENMLKAVLDVQQYFDGGKGAAFDRLVAVYDQYIRTYSYNRLLAPKVVDLNNGYSTFKSTLPGLYEEACLARVEAVLAVIEANVPEEAIDEKVALLTELPGYTFEFEWETSDEEVVSFDSGFAIPHQAEEEQECTIKVTVSYGDETLGKVQSKSLEFTVAVAALEE